MSTDTTTGRDPGPGEIVFSDHVESYNLRLELSTSGDSHSIESGEMLLISPLKNGDFALTIPKNRGLPERSVTMQRRFALYLIQGLSQMLTEDKGA